MKILVVKEKYDRLFVPDDVNSDIFLRSFVRLIEERIPWYEDDDNPKDVDTARIILTDYSDKLDTQESLEKRAESFLRKRKRYEYEGWEIVESEN